MGRLRLLVAGRRPVSGGRLALLALVVLAGATACQPGGMTGVTVPCAPASGNVGGCVTDSRAGGAVAGATITASPGGTTTTTDSQGAYSLALSPGTYDIIATKSGMAASKFQSVVVGGQTARADLIMRSVFDPTMPIAEPTITVSGLSPGDTVTGTRSFTATVAASNAVREIDMRTSNMNTTPQASVLDNTTATFSVNSTLLANGPAFVDIIAYDFNYNAAEVVINFTVSNPPSGVAPVTPAGLTLVAVTTGQSLSLFTTQRATTFAQLGIQQDPSILSVDGQSINLLTAPSNATLFVQASWTAIPGASYKIYRSFSATGPFVQLAERSTNIYQDADPSLAPGLAVYYQVSAFNAGGESAPSAAVSVTPLPAFNLNLVSPANNITGVVIPPTFTWTPTALVGVHQRYDIYVWGVNDANFSWRTSGLFITDTTTITYGTGGTLLAPLQGGKVYQWDIFQARAETVYAANSSAFAVANQSTDPNFLLNRPSGSLNGPFKLTTMQ
ncbi:MAG: carboxypeptidase regulatory-like domain-containing protein [Bacillati bacterium ANGP1]|uniref:Carboxypeptidase regulatory-like domain-containing protein n=1 Tax=Candidatus Segetimicrobium genomatis TaxID=2569760 RepID=A0A537LLI3_9BACT|nr:MAG: carboxypeptidase regulatory-like domain-containing protein [Terrabacteria group bacterium ANGP1]